MYPSRLIVLLLTIIPGVVLNNNCEQFEEICNKKSTHSCAQCIDAHFCCVWKFGEGENTACTIKSRTHESDSVVFGGQSRIEVLKNEDFSVSSPMADEPAVQIRPQKIKAYLRKGEPISFNLTYKATPNYALDLYFLMDLTYSMLPYKENLSKLGIKLAEKLKAMTTNYKIAFGFYSDKVSFPYYRMEESYLKNPCLDKNFECVPGFNFNHAFNFSQRLEEFTEQVNASQHTANLDDYEAGLDALMQIILCQKELSWRKHSRKIVLIATDALLHVAGDGKLAGVTAKVADECKLTQENKYLVYKGLENDYPSVEEIYRRLLRNKMNVLFAVCEPVQQYYESLKSILDEVAYIGILKDDPENVLNLVEKGYMELSKKVHFNPTPNDETKITFRTNCNSETVSEKRFCNNIDIATEYTFNVELELQNFPSDGSYNALIKIEEMNIEEFLEIELEYLGVHCSCNGPQEGNRISHGTYECGKYMCDNGWIGEDCSTECDHTKGRFQNESYTSTTCFNKGEFDINTCKCECYEGYIGKYCQYRQCRRNKGKICSDHGICNDGICVCNDGYTGHICECPQSTDTCKSYETAAICSGRGECVCGMCKCNHTEGILYTGRFCEKCRGCENLCSKYDDDVIALNDGRKIDPITYNHYETQEVQHLNESEETSKCRVFYYNDDFQCSITYTYEVLQDAKIKINYIKECNTYLKAEIFGGVIAAGVFLLLAFALLVWKAYATLQDRKEYMAHLRNQKATSFHEGNPLYKSPVTHVNLDKYKDSINLD